MELTKEDKIKIGEIGRKYLLRFIILHGSYAKGTSQKGSDLDIAILGEGRVPFDTMLEIHRELSQIFGDSPDRDLDLKSMNGVDSFFRYEILRHGVLLYGDPLDFEEFRAYAYRAYVDSSDLRETELALLKKSIRSLATRYAP